MTSFGFALLLRAGVSSPHSHGLSSVMLPALKGWIGAMKAHT